MIDRVVAPTVLYLAVYMTVLFAAVTYGFPFYQWAAFFAVAVATATVVAIRHRGAWDIGIVTRLSNCIGELALGCAAGATVILAGDAFIVATTGLRHSPGHGLPWGETAAVFIPAVLHEELLFRGYLFQRVWRWRRNFAIISGSVVFASLHMWNANVTMIAFLNICLGGILLSVAYERFERLWLPIGMHFAWNMTSGPILGYQVSGYQPVSTLFNTVENGPPWITGGGFGIEGSLALTLVEIVAVLMALHWRRRWKKTRVQNAEPVAQR